MVQNEDFITKKNAAKCKQILRRLRWQVILRLKNVFTYLIFQNIWHVVVKIFALKLNHSKLQKFHLWITRVSYKDLIFLLSLICIVMQQASEGATGQGHFQALKWAKKESRMASLRVGAIMESCWRHQISSVGLCACVVIAMNLSFSKRKLHLKLHWLRARS